MSATKKKQPATAAVPPPDPTPPATPGLATRPVGPMPDPLPVPLSRLAYLAPSMAIAPALPPGRGCLPVVYLREALTGPDGDRPT